MLYSKQNQQEINQGKTYASHLSWQTLFQHYEVVLEPAETSLHHHPFFNRGYVSVGDWHSSRPLMADDDSERDTRFHELKQECGLHLPLTN